MKTTILQLEPHDDWISIRDQMAWSQAARILLVWPLRGSVLRSKMDLELVKRRGTQLGAQVALVTRDPVVRALAKELGLPVFSSTRRAQEKPWHTRVRRSSRALFTKSASISADSLRLRQAGFRTTPSRISRHPLFRIVVFTIALVAVLVLPLYFYPSAQVRLIPAERDQTAELSIWASPAIVAPVPSGGIPAREVILSVTGAEQMDTSGNIEVPTHAAVATVRFTNLTDQVVDVPMGVVVRTLSDPPIRFVTTIGASLAAGPASSADIPVRALLPGSSGNVTADQILALEGELGLRLRVTNPGPAQGGGQVVTNAPTDQDQKNLRARMITKLADQAAEQLSAQLSSNGRPIPASATVKQVLFEEIDPPLGQPGDVLRMTLTVEVSVWVIAEADLLQAAAAGLDASIPAGYQAVPGSLIVNPLGQAQYVPGKLARWQVRAERKLRGAWSQDQVTGWLPGRKPGEAEQILGTRLALAQPPTIQINPAWWVRMPALPARIQVNTP